MTRTEAIEEFGRSVVAAAENTFAKTNSKKDFWHDLEDLERFQYFFIVRRWNPKTVPNSLL